MCGLEVGRRTNSFLEVGSGCAFPCTFAFSVVSQNDRKGLLNCLYAFCKFHLFVHGEALWKVRGGRESVSGDDTDDDGLMILFCLFIFVLTCHEELILETWLADFATANVHG